MDSKSLTTFDYLPSPNTLLSPFNTPTLSPILSPRDLNRDLSTDSIALLPRGQSSSIPNLSSDSIIITTKKTELTENCKPNDRILSPRISNSHQVSKKQEKSESLDKRDFWFKKPKINDKTRAQSARIDRGKSEGILTKRQKLLVTENSAKTINSPDFEKHEVALRDAVYTLSMNDGGWILVGYEDNSTLCVQATSETDNIPELVNNLRDKEVQYAIVKLDIDGDELNIQPNIFIRWVGPEVPHFERSKMKVHVGKVANYFRPFHAELSAISKQNFTREKIIKLMGSSGNHVID